MKYKLSTKKPDGKWWSWGRVDKNQYGNLQASFKVTPELIKLFQDKEGGYINFSMFEDKPKEDTHNQQKADGYQPQPSANHLLSDEIPFIPNRCI